jgi:hypothetical protein
VLAVFDTPDFMTLAEDPKFSIEPMISNDDTGDDTDARVSFHAEPGRTYYVLVLGYEMGPYQIQVESTPLPTSAPGKPALLTPLKKLSPDEIATSTLGVEVWEFTAPEDRWVKVRMESGAFDAYVVVKSGQNGSTVIAEDDDSGGDFNAEVIFLARANQTYYIHAQMLGGGEGGAYNLKALWIEPPAEVQPDLPTSGALPGEQVWTFTAPATQRVLLQLSDLEFNPHVIVREGGPEGNVVVESPSSKTVVFQAEAGTVYYIWIGVSEGMEEEAGGME